jgi:hypothetical protein
VRWSYAGGSAWHCWKDAGERTFSAKTISRAAYAADKAAEALAPAEPSWHRGGYCRYRLLPISALSKTSCEEAAPAAAAAAAAAALSYSFSAAAAVASLGIADSVRRKERRRGTRRGSP